ncbi:MAG: lytic transglycosylase domain-containing protein, partial [Solirubrobacteraceae bacterium]|nr:lytic transglycosylase domain-containing protein [Solirubrobacteraceae bacterium]
KGAKGLGQLMPSVWKRQIRDPFDSQSNVTASINHLTYLKTQLGDWRRVFRAYVAGEAYANSTSMDWYADAVMMKVKRWEKVWE